MRRGTGVARVFDGLVTAMAVLAGVTVLALGILITVAVLSRYFFGRPMAWVVEISEYCLLWGTLLAAPWVLKQDGHVRIDILLVQFRGRARRILDAVINGIGFSLSFLFFVLSTWITYDNHVRGITIIKMLALPKSPMMAVIPLGFLLLAYQFGRTLLQPRQTPLRADDEQR